MAQLQSTTITGSNASVVLRVQSPASSSLLFVSGSGNVGIGTTNPDVKFQVQGGAVKAATSNYAAPSTGGAISMFQDSNDYGTIWAVKNYNGAWANVSISPLGGNVGIGTTSPKQKLIVEGTLATKPSGVDGYYSYLRSNWSENDAFELGISNDGNSVFHKLITSSNYYFGSTLQFWTSDTEKMRITSAGNVGIGEVTPTARLEVKGSGTTSATTALRIENANASSSMVVLDDGNVGIGTTSPTSKLYIEGGSANWNETTPGLSVGTIHLDPGADTNDFGNAITFGASDSSGGTNAQAGIYLRSDGNYGTKMYFATTDSYVVGSKTRMFIGHDGNVGIGTTSPGYKLDVNGNTNITGNLFFNSNSTLQAARRYVSTATLSNAGYTVIGTVTGDALASSIRISLQGTTAGTVINVMADILVNHYQDILITSYAGIYTLLTLRVISDNNELYSIEATTDSPNACTTYVEIFPLNNETVVFGGSAQTGTSLTHVCVPGINISATGGSSGNLAVGGNVGIGTTSPGSKLHVNGGFVRVEGSSTDQYFLEGVRTGGNTTLRIYDNSNNLYYDSYGSMYFRANQNGGSGGVVGFLGGNVGIGEASPSARLEVKGSGATSATTALRVENSSATTSMVVLDDGNVGIGTTSPGYRLHVKDSANVGTIAIGNDSYPGLLYSNAGSGEFRVDNRASAGAGYITFYPNGQAGTIGSEAMRITTAGNVGIGTTSPASLLHIYKTSYPVFTLGSGVVTGNVGIDTANNFMSIGTETNHALSFATNNSAKMRIDASGNVGIGETSPTARLEVKGSGTTSATTTLRVENANASSSMVVLDDGSVGIGTTSPSSKLDVSVTPSAAWMNLINANETAFRLTTYNNGTNNGSSIYAFKHGLYYNTTENAAVTFYRGGSSVGGFLTFTTDNGAERMRIATDGNVGIGNATPAFKLDVAGTARFSSNLTITGSVSASSYTGSLLGTASFATTAQTATTASFVATAQTASYVLNAVSASFAQTARSASYAATAQSATSASFASTAQTATTASYVLQAVSASFATSASRAVSSSFAQTAQTATTASYVAAPGATTQVVINSLGALSASSGFVFNAGNVGIGEASPGARLEVRGSGATSATTAFRVENSSAATSMVVLDDGDVGIGTASPAYKLVVETAGAVDGIALNGSNNFVLAILESGTVRGYSPAFPTSPGAFSTDSNTRDFVYRVEAATQRFLFNTNGGAGGSTLAITGSRVGINTATPTLASLTVNGNVWANSYTGSLFGTASFANNATSASFAISSSRTVSASYALTASFALNGGGGGSTINVSYNGASVGTFSLLNFTGSGVTVTDKGAGTVDIYFPTSGSGGGGGTPGGADGQVQYNNGGSFGGAISMSYDDTNHRVGIGTNSPGHTLTVVGGLSITGSNLSSTSLRFQDSSGVSRHALYVSSSNWLTLGNPNYEGVDLIKNVRISGSLLDALGSPGGGDNSLTSVGGELIWANPPATAKGDYDIDIATPYTLPGGWDNVFINGGNVRATSPVTVDNGNYKLVSTVTMGLQNNSGSEQLMGLSFRLYNNNTTTPLTDTTHHYASYMSKDENVNMTVFTFHIPIYLNEVGESDDIYLQANTSTLPTPDIYYGALTLMKIRA
jgi:hypothetical protein